MLEHAGLRSVRLHDLRDTYASLMLQAGEAIAYVKERANRAAVDRVAAATAATDQSAQDSDLTSTDRTRAAWSASASEVCDLKWCPRQGPPDTHGVLAALAPVTVEVDISRPDRPRAGRGIDLHLR